MLAHCQLFSSSVLLFNVILTLIFFSSAIDIKDLKILDFRNDNSRTTSAAPAKVTSAPVAIPKGDPRSVEKLNSPQHCSKSYGERHLDIPGQPKGFRRRHNSCMCNAVKFTKNELKYSSVAKWLTIYLSSPQGQPVIEG